MTTSPSRRGRGRPRTPGAEERILTAALEEYGEHGWAGFTMDAVARRAGVGKSTVYLRWHDKDALLTEAVSLRGHSLADVDTGALRTDLEQLARNLLTHYRSSEGWATMRVTFDTASSPDPLGRFATEVTEVHADFVERIYQRAVERGEARPDLLSGLIAETIYGACIVHSLTARLEAHSMTDDEINDRAAILTTLVLEGVGL